MAENFNEIKTLLRRVQAFKGQTTSVRSFIALYLNRNPLDGKLDDRVNKYIELFSEIVQVVEQLDELDPEFEHHPVDLKDILEDEYNKNIAEYERIMSIAKGEKSESVNSSTGDDGRVKMRKVKLPDAPPPKFNGEYENWLSFKAEFESLIHNRDDISATDKMSYLRASLSGSAYDKIKMMNINGENYSRAWKILKKTYSDKRILISRHLKLLLSLPLQEKETANGISQLVDATRQHLEVLKTLEVEIGDHIVVALIESKLHKYTADSWDEKLVQGVYPKLKDLYKFLTQRASRIVNRTGNNNSSTRSEGSTEQKKIYKRSYTQAFLNTDKKCTLCDDKLHPLFRCNTFRNMTLAQRTRIVDAGSFCANCLRNNHKTADCNSKNNCWVCSQRHNTLLHTDIQSGTSKALESTTN